MRLKADYRIYIFTILAAPVAFGSVEQWSLSAMEGLLAASTLVLLLRLFFKRSDLVRVPGLLPLSLFLGYVLLQSVPLPPSIIRAISPSAYEAHTAIASGTSHWLTIALDSRSAVLEFFRYSSYGLAYFLAVQLFSRSRILRSALYTVATVVSILAFLSVLAWLSSGNDLMWIRPNPWNGPHFGPFVNKNHYAGFMGMAIPLVYGLYLATRPDLSGREDYSLSARISSVLSHRTVNRHILFGLGTIIIAGSVVLSLSRAGMIATLLSALFFAALMLRRERRSVASIAVVALTAFIALLWFGIDPVLERFADLSGNEGGVLGARREIMLDSLRAALDFPLTGAGFGSFAHVYPAYRTLDGRVMVDHAHNDYIEMMVEGGLISSALLLWFVISVFLYCKKCLSADRNSRDVSLAYASAAGIFYMLLHATVDFNFHVASNGLFFFFLCGVLVSVSSVGISRKKKRKLAAYPRVSVPVGLVLVSVLCISLMSVNMGIWRGRSAYTDYIKGNSSSIVGLNTIKKAAVLDPRNTYYSLLLASEEARGFNYPGAVNVLHTALADSPLCGECYLQLASHYSLLDEGADAEPYFRAALRYATRKTDKYMLYAWWLARQGRTEESLDVFGQGVYHEPKYSMMYFNKMFSLGFTFDQMQRIVTERHETLHALSIVAARAHAIEAASLLQLAAANLIHEPLATGKEYRMLYMAFTSLGEKEFARNILIESVRRFPRNKHFVLELAKVYERMGNIDKAIETYIITLELDPFNKTATKRLAALRR